MLYYIENFSYLSLKFCYSFLFKCYLYIDQNVKNMFYLRIANYYLKQYVINVMQIMNGCNLYRKFYFNDYLLCLKITISSAQCLAMYSEDVLYIYTNKSMKYDFTPGWSVLLKA